MRWWLALLLLAASLSPLPAAAEYDRKLFCKDGADEVMVLIDITSELDERALELLSDGVQKIVEQLDPGEQLRIATITDQFTTSNALVTECDPYCQSGFFDMLIGNCTEGLLRLENKRLLTVVREALRTNLLATAPLDYSDILRTVNAVTRTRTPGRHLELFIFSDLIENSAFMSGKDFWGLKTSTLLARVKSSQLVPDLTDTTVHAFGVGRAGSGERKALPQSLMKSLTAFWMAYFEAAGTTSITLSEYLVSP